MTIQDILRGYRLSALKSIAATREIEIEAKRKAPLVTELAEKLFAPEGARAAFAKLTDAEQKVFLRLIRAPGPVHTADLVARLEETQVIAPEPRPRFSVYRRREPIKSSPQGPPTFDDIFARLNGLGLAFNVPSSTGPTRLHGLVPGEQVVVPDVVRQHIPVEVASYPTAQVDDLDVRRSPPAVFQRDLYFSWDYIRAHPLSLTAKGWVSKRDLNKINAALTEPEDLQRVRTEETAGRLHLLRQLLQKLGLLVQTGNELHHSEKETTFFEETPFERTRVVHQHWLDLSEWNEIQLIPGLRARGISGSTSSPLPNARRAIVKLIKHIPPEQWIKLEDFLEIVRDVDRDFLLTRSRQYGYVTSPYSRHSNPYGWDFRFYDEKKGWQQVEARLIEQLLTGPLFWMGLIALAYRGDTAVAFQITPFGAQVLGLRPPEETRPHTGRLVIQPNFDILAMDGVGDRVLVQLDRFADRVRQERVLEYRLSRDSVYRAQKSGMQVQEILKVLETESHHPVPQNVRYALEEWDRLYNQIVVRPSVSLCQVADPALLDILQRDQTFRRALIRRVSPTLALLRGSKGSMEKLLSALTEKGHMPIRTSPDTASPRVQDRFYIESDGRLIPVYNVPNLFVRHELSVFAEDRDTGLCLTPDAVKAAVERGMTVDGILDVLQCFVVGDLPRSVIEAVRRWGNYFGTLQIEKPVLLAVENEKLLRELRADPDLRPLLKPFEPPYAVAIVKKGKLTQVRKVLKEKGIEVE